jgi:hypothetical protein
MEVCLQTAFLEEGQLTNWFLGGTVTDSQLFSFSGGAGPLVLAPKNGNNGICMNVKGNTLDQTSCNLAIPEASEVRSDNIG